MKKRYTIAAACFSKDGVGISHGYNSYTKTHPLQKYFAEKVGQPNKIYLHAEIMALIRAKDTIIYHMKVARINNNTGDYDDAKPCPICIEAIKAFGVKKVSYTTKEGWVYGKTPESLAAN